MIAWGRRITNAPWDYFDLNVHGLVSEIWPDLGQPASGFINPREFLFSLLALAPQIQFIEDWVIPCAVTSVDLATMSPVVFTPHRPSKLPKREWQIIGHAWPLRRCEARFSSLCGWWSCQYLASQLGISVNPTSGSRSECDSDGCEKRRKNGYW